MNGDGSPSWSTFLTDVEPTHRVSTGNRLTHLRDDDRAVRSIGSYNLDRWTARDESSQRLS